MQFRKVHIEVTNICGLACSFCPPKIKPSKIVDGQFFQKILEQLEGKTKLLAFHILGDPLTLSNLGFYLDSAKQKGFAVELTTSGYYLKKTAASTIFHSSVRQLNISLNSFNKNSLSMSFEEYMQEVFSVCDYKLYNAPEAFINLRLWNLDTSLSETEFNQKLFSSLQEHFGVTLELESIYRDKVKSIRLAPKILLHFENYFEWPSLQSSHQSHGYCYGLESHFGILADGTVVPCCLDGEGVIALGNLHEQTLDEVLHSQRAQNILEGFRNNKAVEELCQKCSYKDRF
ncbi:MAG: SPASM domain-containing protein [Campylobacterales bacterium]|nr:SPASM domain-containing protein [Campylobacterales bacterium]